MLFHSRLPNTKFEKERGIILEELAKDKESEQYLLERLLEAETFPKSSYGLPVLGTEHSIRTLSRSDVLNFYHRYYVPENMVAILLGGFDPDEAQAILEKTFGAQPAGGSWPDPPASPLPIRASRIIRHSASLSRSWIRLIWNAPDPGAENFLATQTAADLLFGGDQSPLAEALGRDGSAGVLSVAGRIVAGPGFGRLIIDIETDPGAPLEEIHAATLDLIADLELPSESRLAGWKVAGEAEEIFARQRGYMFAPLYSEDLALHGTWGLQTRLEHSGALSINDVRKATGVVASGPCVAILIDAPKGPAADPKTDPPARELPYSVQDTLLSNGAHLLAMDAPADGSLSIYILIEGRNYLEPVGQEGITELLHSLLPAGSGAMTEAEFSAALDRIGGDVQCADRGFIPFDDYYTGRDFSFIRFQALDRYAPEAFALLGQMLKRPRLDSAAVERNRGRLGGRLERDAGSASQVAALRLRELLISADHPEARGAFGSPGSVATLTREDLRAHHGRLLDPRRIWIGIVSGRPLRDLCEWAETMLPTAPDPDSPTLQMTPARFALWESRGRLGTAAAERWQALLDDPASFGLEFQEDGRLLIDRRPSTGRQRAHVQEICLLPEGAGEAAEIATGWLSSQLALDLREEQGLAYGIGASLWRLGDRSFYAAGAGTRLENVAAMRSGLVTIRRAAAERAPLLPEAQVHRIANKRYGRTLRRQEVRLNQAMFSVWSARAGDSPLAWWHAARGLRDLPAKEMRRALEDISVCNPTLLVVIE